MASSHFLPDLPVEQLQLHDIKDIFHITQSRKPDWRVQAQCEIPDSCNLTLDIIDRFDSEYDEACEIATRLRLPVLVAAAFDGSPDKVDGETRLKLHGKHRFSLDPVKYKGEMYCLQGHPSWNLQCRPDGSARDDLAINFVAVEQAIGKSSDGIPQALAYMGMIYRQRQYEGRSPNEIFGLSTDHGQFHFLRMSTKGKWSQMDMDSSHRQQIVNMLSHIHQQASIQSTAEDRGPSALGNPLYDLAGIFRCLWQRFRNPVKHTGLKGSEFRADYIPVPNDYESGYEESEDSDW